MHMLIMKNMANNTMYNVQELHDFVFNKVSSNGIVFSGIAFNRNAFKFPLCSILFPSVFLLYSLINLSVILFVHLQLL